MRWNAAAISEAVDCQPSNWRRWGCISIPPSPTPYCLTWCCRRRKMRTLTELTSPGPDTPVSPTLAVVFRGGASLCVARHLCVARQRAGLAQSSPVPLINQGARVVSPIGVPQRASAQQKIVSRPERKVSNQFDQAVGFADHACVRVTRPSNARSAFRQQ
jgi:hypothetical protein